MTERNNLEMTSRLPGFYDLPLSERAKLAARLVGLSEEELKSLSFFGPLSSELTDTFIENSVGTYSLPLGIATNFKINGKDVLIPMAVEESSVLAAASHGAKLARCGGGFHTASTKPIMTGQVQVFLPKPLWQRYEAILKEHQSRLVEALNARQERLVSRGGGAQGLTWRFIPEIESLVLHLQVDTRDAMGANIVNTMCEQLALFMPEIFPGCDVGLRILTNLTDQRMAKAECLIPASAFNHRHYSGQEVIQRIVKAWEFAWFDPYRAVTHNKGVMNGVDPVVIATGNDWRAIEAGAHAFCSRSGVYRPMTTWKQTSGGDLFGSLELPMAVGTVGGVTKLHPSAKAALKVLGAPSARELGEIIVAVGLAQNLSALRALATEGIQLGHMSLHQKNIDLLAKI